MSTHTLIVLVLAIHLAMCELRFKTMAREKEREILDQILSPEMYDPRIRPSGENGTDGPAIVRVNMFVRTITHLSEVRMGYSVQLTFRQQWLDERLKFPDFGGRLKYLTLNEAYRVWVPDLFFSNEEEGHFHNLLAPNTYIRIFPNGAVLYSLRISLTLSCPMNLKLYPFDRQVCSMRMASYGYTTEDIIFLWKEGDPVQVVKNLELPLFALEKFSTDYCNSKTNTGEYSCLKVDLLFRRKFHFYLMQVYVPCIMLVIISWISFWLDQNAVHARVSLGFTTVFTIVILLSNINAFTPPVSYTMAINVWTRTCVTFVFAALLEFAFINHLSRSNTKKQQIRCELEHAGTDTTSELINEDSNNATSAMKRLILHPGDPEGLDKNGQCEVQVKPTRLNYCQRWLAKYPVSKRIDVISRIAFPLAFALFNVVYWSTYLHWEEA